MDITFGRDTYAGCLCIEVVDVSRHVMQLAGKFGKLQTASLTRGKISIPFTAASLISSGPLIRLKNV